MTATRTYLEMLRPSDLRSSPLPEDARVVHVADPAPSFWRYLYSEVGREYRWTDRLGWTDEEIATYLADPAIDLWILKAAEDTAGYFELRRHADDAIEIAYFGLLPDFVGRGLGKGLLTAAVSEAWRASATRVWLHTSSLDHHAALPNYLGRGFSIFKRETYEVT